MIRVWFYRLGRLESASFIALLAVAMPLKYAADLPQAVRWIGWLHGVLFLAYLFALLLAARTHRIGLPRVLAAGVLATLPFGPIVLERRWRRDGVLGEAAPT